MPRAEFCGRKKICPWRRRRRWSAEVPFIATSGSTNRRCSRRPSACCGAQPEVGQLRLAGALYALLACALAWRFAGDMWGPAEAAWAAALLAFFLTFDTASAVTPLAADLLMLAPHLVAVYLAWRGRVFWSWRSPPELHSAINSKGLVCARGVRAVGLSVATRAGGGLRDSKSGRLGWLWSQGALRDYYDEVWKWGRVYAARTFVEHPVRNAIVRTAGWFGFHATLLIPAIWYFEAEQDRGPMEVGGVADDIVHRGRLGMALFSALFLSDFAGLGSVRCAWDSALMPRRARIGLIDVALLFLWRASVRDISCWPADLMTGRPHDWVDVLMDRDSREAAAKCDSLKPATSLFVWGFRPEIVRLHGAARRHPIPRLAASHRSARRPAPGRLYSGNAGAGGAQPAGADSLPPGADPGWTQSL